MMPRSYNTELRDGFGLSRDVRAYIWYPRVPGGAVGYVTLPGIVRGLRSRLQGRGPSSGQSDRSRPQDLWNADAPAWHWGETCRSHENTSWKVRGVQGGVPSPRPPLSAEGEEGSGGRREGKEGEEEKASRLASGLTSGLLPRSSASSQRHSSL